VAATENVVGPWRSLSQKARAEGADPKLMDELVARQGKAGLPRRVSFKV
jgi:hypothetical protein